MRPINGVENAGKATFEAEAILGQCCYALGQGAGNMRIRRCAIVALRARYLDPLRNAASTWDDLAGSVLPLLGQVGRLAALLATQAGRTAIHERDFTQARRVVESSAHQSSGLLIAGPVCPPVPAEFDEELVRQEIEESILTPVTGPSPRIPPCEGNLGRSAH